ncbi:MAG: TatD family hydrolase, partial [Candidatus Saccharibacteria bacterium]
LNGIMTFTKDQAQLEAAKIIPADRLLLETDCPYLSPAPMRGQRNEPSFIKYTGEFLAALRGEQYSELISLTATNAKGLFELK